MLLVTLRLNDVLHKPPVDNNVGGAPAVDHEVRCVEWMRWMLLLPRWVRRDGSLLLW